MLATRFHVPQMKPQPTNPRDPVLHAISHTVFARRIPLRNTVTIYDREDKTYTRAIVTGFLREPGTDERTALICEHTNPHMKAVYTIPITPLDHHRFILTDYPLDLTNA